MQNITSPGELMIVYNGKLMRAVLMS
jgi:hypothetical protein